MAWLPWAAVRQSAHEGNTASRRAAAKGRRFVFSGKCASLCIAAVSQTLPGERHKSGGEVTRGDAVSLRAPSESEGRRHGLL